MIEARKWLQERNLSLKKENKLVLTELWYAVMTPGSQWVNFIHFAVVTF